MNNWTPEPWEGKEGDNKYEYYVNEKGSEYNIAIVCDGVDGMHSAEANAARIVACVNACAGIPTECLGDDDWKTLIAGRKERDALRNSLQSMVEYAEEHAEREDERWGTYHQERRDRIRAEIARARGLLG
jgi:hypothetical protein